MMEKNEILNHIMLKEEEMRAVISFNGNGIDLDHLEYAFFGREFILGTGQADFACPFSYMYPFNLIAFSSGESSVTVIAGIQDLKRIHFVKKEDICFCEFEYRNYVENKTPCFIPHTNSSDFLMDAIRDYRIWYQDTFGRLPKSAASFHGKFNVKRYFFHHSDMFFGPYSEPPRSIFDGNEVRLADLFVEDENEVGVDVALLFDYAFRDGIRCGNKEPFPFGEDKRRKINEQILGLREKYGTVFMAYLDPYYVEEGSDWDRAFRKTDSLLDAEGNPVRVWNPRVWTPDLRKETWKKETCHYMEEVVSGLSVDGIYLDEFGNGMQFSGENGCKEYDQVDAEKEYLRFMKAHIKDVSWMCEFPPAAPEAKEMDVVLSDTRTLINIYRFVFPELKFVRVINCDAPIGSSFPELNKALFNGEGLWLDHDIRNQRWYPDELKQMIKEQTDFKREYAAFFESVDVTPLYRIDGPIYVNRYALPGKELLMVYNNGTVQATTAFHMEGKEKCRLVYQQNCSITQEEDRIVLRLPAFSVCGVLIGG